MVRGSSPFAPNKNVKQYNPVNGTYITCSDIEEALEEKIIRGDGGDGITNIISSPDSFLTNTRQKSISKNLLEQYLISIPLEYQSNYQRNKTLIDLTQIPSDISISILYHYNNSKTKSSLYKYLVNNKLTAFLDDIQYL